MRALLFLAAVFLVSCATASVDGPALLSSSGWNKEIISAGSFDLLTALVPGSMILISAATLAANDIFRALRPHSAKPFDVHLMIAPVDRYVQDFAFALQHDAADEHCVTPTGTMICRRPADYVPTRTIVNERH